MQQDGSYNQAQNQENPLSAIIFSDRSIMESLATNAPEALLNFVDKNDERQYLYATGQEQTKLRIKKEREKTIRFAISIIGLLVLCSLGYATTIVLIVNLN